MVTVEPGFYFIDQLLDEAKAKPIGKMIDWNRVAQLKHFGGVRIEDNVVARPGGQENLTQRRHSVRSHLRRGSACTELALLSGAAFWRRTCRKERTAVLAGRKHSRR